MKNNISYNTILDSYSKRIIYNFSEPDEKQYKPGKFIIGDFDVANAFYKKALQCYNKQDFLIATFMMQQATKLTYTALILKFMGRYVRGENISTLRKVVLLYLPNFKDVFPCNNEQEYNLLQQLEKADFNIKYIPDFNISAEEVLQLLERVEDLLAMAEEFSNKYT